MEQSFSRPKLPGSARMRARGALRALVAVALLVAVPLLLVSLFRQESAVRFSGVVESGAENVGPVEASRIVSIEVVEGQRVEKGDVLVRFDSADRLLDDSLNEVRIREYEQGLAKRREAILESERRGRQLVHDAEVKLEECRMDRTRDQAELAGLEAELARLQPLAEKKLVSELELLAVRPKAEALKRTVSQYEPLIAALERRHRAAVEDLAALERQKAAAEVEIGEAANAVRAAAGRSEALRRADPTVLRALTDGEVSRVFRRQGDIVAAGEPVLRIKGGTDAVYVSGMLPSGMLDAIRVGDELFVTRLEFARGQAPQCYRARVESIDAEVLDFFDPFNSAPRTPVRGRKARIRVTDDGVGLVPGEPVVVSDAAQRGLMGLFSAGATRKKEQQ